MTTSDASDPKVSFLDCRHDHRELGHPTFCIDCGYPADMDIQVYFAILCDNVAATDASRMREMIRGLEKILGIKEIVTTINNVDSNCICTRVCDCAHPEPRQGEAAGISNECPVHNDQPQAHRECPAENHFAAPYRKRLHPDAHADMMLMASDHDNIG